ncbi:hypothetical protein FD50_GL001908 [Liquorilactobacillus satsumensis DSM 16230 = JCM 12392]|uniref:MaoC-like domain-containing protein n=1 Tax=Liquorilactobacillus satsumensis DSM 16230 = JCM 12392 TaxID=1423801 RepID=A0A0R1UWD9_9LACO|nr:hypothetical protein FD50_GL001908 [Liquorilactobacillus satsumensis DSM 16230 = JCM 12392]
MVIAGDQNPKHKGAQGIVPGNLLLGYLEKECSARFCKSPQKMALIFHNVIKVNTVIKLKITRTQVEVTDPNGYSKYITGTWE